MDCNHLEDLYELYVLGVLAAGEGDDVRKHVGGKCPRCLDALREAAEAVYWLAQTVAPVQPRPAVRAGLLRRLASYPTQAGGPRKARVISQRGATSTRSRA
jgi:hypothetical protein